MCRCIVRYFHKPSPAGAACGSGEGGYGKKCLHCFAETGRGRSPEGRLQSCNGSGRATSSVICCANATFPEARQRRRGKAFLRKYRTIKVVDWRVHFSSDAPANFAGLLGSSARKTLQWRVFSENGLTSPGGKSRNLQDAAGGKGTAKRTAVLCGISLSVIHAGNHRK